MQVCIKNKYRTNILLSCSKLSNQCPSVSDENEALAISRKGFYLIPIALPMGSILQFQAVFIGTENIWLAHVILSPSMVYFWRLARVPLTCVFSSLTEREVCQTPGPASQLSEDWPVHVQSKSPPSISLFGFGRWVSSTGRCRKHSHAATDCWRRQWRMCCVATWRPYTLTINSSRFAEQLSSQQPREAAGPQINRGPSHQYHLL